MSMRLGLLLGLLTAAQSLAQVATNGPGPAAPLRITDPAAVTVSNAPFSGERMAPKKKAGATPKPVLMATARKTPAAAPTSIPAPTNAPVAPPLAINAPAVVGERIVVVRGKADINGETIGHLKRGDTVTVLEEVTIHPKMDEPSRWAKIALPAGIHVWVNQMYLDTNGAVQPPKLNVRTGPGENYSVVGLLHKGDVIAELSRKGDWREIAAPAGTYAFVAAHLLRPAAAPAAEKPAVVVAPTPKLVEPPRVVAPPAPALTTTTVLPPPAKPTAPPAAPATANPPLATTPPPAPVVVPAAPALEAAPTTPTTPPPAAELPVAAAVPATPIAPAMELPAKRIVQREGIVRGLVSIQAPTHFQLQSLDNGKIINYLYGAGTNVDWKKLRGRTVIVTGEEGLDERWPNTPVIMVDQVKVIP